MFEQRRVRIGMVLVLGGIAAGAAGAAPPDLEKLSAGPTIQARLSLNRSCAAARDEINNTCYGGGDQTHRDEAILLVLERTLRLRNDACREAALHGLGHWAGSYPARVKKAIEDFLNSHPDLRPELKQYALNAKSGHVN